jgi:UDP-N-acetylglucosamine--N-acetylmuramyl-(pentapeptide) pyrophosphoryl-undecaprenol N-acetylglucosamine transferase
MKRIMFAGGGTGGHLFPAFALAQEFQRRLPGDCDIRFFVTGRDIEMKLITSRGYATTRIHVRGLRRGTLVGNAMFFPVLFFGILEAIARVIKYDPNLVVGTGGYLSFPAVLAAKMTNRPAFIQEQNSYAGIATQKLARFADLIFIAYQESLRNIKFHDKCILSGNPVNPKMGTVDREEGIARFKLDPSKKTLLILGGSQGAASINAKIRQSLGELKSISNLQLLWQVGNHPSEIDTFHSSDTNGLALQFIDDMPAAYAAADLVLSRAGALTLAEITATGKPAILVPFPYATDDHQTKNAQALEKAGAAMIIKDSQLPELNLVSLVSQLLKDEDKLASMSMASLTLGRRDAAQAIVQKIFEYMGWR